MIPFLPIIIVFSSKRGITASQAVEQAESAKDTPSSPMGHKPVLCALAEVVVGPASRANSAKAISPGISCGAGRNGIQYRHHLPRPWC